ncbi:MAG: undecaprenyl-diphosphate phosphatase [Candidatus Thorarchaeota archaeon]|nr:undecaprenyl-diphosphate phosphatase [Candidatus Thorarchaeota archaeon]
MTSFKSSQLRVFIKEGAFMEPWQLIVALIQGLVEWLPISSEGQAILFVYNFSSVPSSALVSVVIWLHLGTALAVIVRYPRDFWRIITLKDRNLFRLLMIATIATAVAGIPLYFFLKGSITAFHGEIINMLVGGMLFATALILYLPTRHNPDEVLHTEEVDDKKAGFTGLVQGFSVLPGLSRSGVTMSALLMQHVDKEKALWFSFLMSVPAVIAAVMLDVLTGEVVTITIPLGELIIMEAIVFVVGLASMEALLRLARKIEFWKLCVVLGTVAIVFGIPALL